MTASTAVFKNFYPYAGLNDFQVQIGTQDINFPNNFFTPWNTLPYKKWASPIDKYWMCLGYEASILPDKIHTCTYF